MKNLILIALVALAFQVVAQKNNVQSAANSLKYDEYEEGKKYIDLATVHPKTVNDPKMWYYRGKVYLAIHDKKKDIDTDDKEPIWEEEDAPTPFIPPDIPISPKKKIQSSWCKEKIIIFKHT